MNAACAKSTMLHSITVLTPWVLNIVVTSFWVFRDNFLMTLRLDLKIWLMFKKGEEIVPEMASPDLSATMLFVISHGSAVPKLLRAVTTRKRQASWPAAPMAEDQPDAQVRLFIHSGTGGHLNASCNRHHRSAILIVFVEFNMYIHIIQRNCSKFKS